MVAVECGSFDCDDVSLRSLLGGDPRVKSVKRDLEKRTLATASWGLDRIDPPMDGTYAPFMDGSGVTVYIVDTGVDCTHAELLGHCSNVYDGFNIQLTSNNDGHGHGTHVAGTAGGVTVGVAPAVSIAGVKVLSDSGSGSTSSVLAGLEYIYDHGDATHSVISMSIGGICDDIVCDQDSTVQAIDDYLSPAGFTVVVAAANDACDACVVSPAAARTAITVGATNPGDVRASYSNYGACVDIYAPGTSITSACASGTTEMSAWCEGEYLTISGTSMATPHVSGIVAHLLQWSSFSLTPKQVKEVLQDGGTYMASLDTEGGRPVFAVTPYTHPPPSEYIPNNNGYVTPQSWVCDKGWTGSSCATPDPFLLNCSAPEIRLMVYTVNGDSSSGWPEGESFSVGDDYNTVLMNGTLSCNYAAVDQMCTSVSSSYILVYCAPFSTSLPSVSARELYVDSCAWGAWPGEFFFFNSTACGDFLQLADYPDIAHALCPPDVASSYTHAPTYAPTYAPSTRTPTYAPSRTPTYAPSRTPTYAPSRAPSTLTPSTVTEGVSRSHSETVSNVIIAVPTVVILLLVVAAFVQRKTNWWCRCNKSHEAFEDHVETVSPV